MSDYYKKIQEALTSPFLSTTEAVTKAVVDPVTSMAADAGDALKRANSRALDFKVPADQTFLYQAPPEGLLAPRIDNAIADTRQYSTDLGIAANMEPNSMKRLGNNTKLEMVVDSLRNLGANRGRP